MSSHKRVGDNSVLEFLTEQLMEYKIQSPAIIQGRKLSNQLRAVLLIFNADADLRKAVSPFINFETQSIHWAGITKLPLSSGHRNALAWAYGVWTDEILPKSKLLDGALNLGPSFKIAILEALCLRWGLRG